MTVRELPTAEIIATLRKASSTWFRNSDALLLEELFRRVPKENAPADPVDKGAENGALDGSLQQNGDTTIGA